MSEQDDIYNSLPQEDHLEEISNEEGQYQSEKSLDPNITPDANKSATLLEDSTALKVDVRKKIIKSTIIFAIASLLIYSMFLSDKKSENNVDVEAAPQTMALPSEVDGLSNKAMGTIASKNDYDIEPSKKPNIDIPKQDNNPSINNASIANESTNDVYGILAQPELPPIPDLSTVNVKTTENDNKNNNVPVNNNPATGGVVTNNGIPIVNSADLSPQQKRSMNMFILSGGGPSINPEVKDKDTKKDFIIFDGSSFTEKREKSQVTAQKIGNLDTTLVQGKILDAVLETAINSQLPGPVRAIVSNDVFGEAGDKVLIPRGSRLFGTYSSTIQRGQSRIDISWTRVIRPDGIVITMTAKASDQFGRAGIEADVNTRFGATIANSLLFTGIQLGTALLLDKISGNQGQTQSVNSNGTFVTTNVRAFNVAAQSAINTASDLIKRMIGDGSDIKQVNSLPQGTRTKVVILQDIELPPFRKAMLSG